MANIDIRGMSLTYQENTGVRKIFQNVNLKIGPRGMIGIVGESGSGKSSLLNLIAGFQQADKGNISVDVPREMISFVFQNHNLIDHLNVEKNVALPLVLFGKSESESLDIARDKLEEVGILELAEKNIECISGGQQARVSLARGIASDPEILLADEPTGSLDCKNSKMVMKLLQKIGEDHLVLVVTHEEDLAREYCNQIYKINNYNLELIKENDPEREKLTTREKAVIKKRKIKIKENVKLSFSFLKKRFKKVILSSLFCSICFALMLVIINVKQTGINLLNELSTAQVDFSCVSLVERREIHLKTQDMSLVKKVRLSDESEAELQKLDSDIEYFPALDYFLKPLSNFTFEGKYLESETFFLPCFPTADKINGKIPTNSSEVIVNQNFLSENPGIDIGSMLCYENDVIIETNYLSSSVKDLVHIDFNLEIVGVTKEENIISRPSVYYDYQSMLTILKKIKLENTSHNYSYDIFLSDRMSYLSYEDDPLTSFKTIAKVDDPIKLSRFIEEKFPNIEISNSGLDLAKSIDNLIDSLAEVVGIFLVLIIACAFFLELVFISNLYQDKKREFALYLAFHLNKNEFMNTGVGQAIIISQVIIFFTIVFFIVFSFLGNVAMMMWNFPLFFSINLSLSVIGLTLLLEFLFAYFAGQIPLRQIYSQELVKNLRGE